MTTTRWQRLTRDFLNGIRRHARTTAIAGSVLLVHGFQHQQARTDRLAGMGTIDEGSPVPPLALVAADGRELRLQYGADERPTVLYFFSPSCGWCERNWNNVAALERGTRDHFRFVALSTSSDVDRVRTAHGLTFDMYSGVSERQRRAHGFIGTPHTVVVSPAGRVLKAWAGAYNEQIAREIAAYFHIDLPGLAPRS